MKKEKYVAYVSSYTMGHNYGIRVYDVDMEKWIKIKEDYNNKRYNPGVVFGDNNEE